MVALRLWPRGTATTLSTYNQGVQLGAKSAVYDCLVLRALSIARSDRLSRRCLIGRPYRLTSKRVSVLDMLLVKLHRPNHF